MTNSSSTTFDVAIAGAGPAGTSAAIRLALHGVRVLLVEEKKFPRAKLCGEFISPECIDHFRQLGVIDQMLSAGATSLRETVFYSARGHKVAVPSEWFTSGATALGLSRSEMDHRLLERAKAAGVMVLEDAHAAGLIFEDVLVCGMKVKTADGLREYRSKVTIDATGRSRALARHLEREQHRPTMKRRRGLVAFKAHLENARVAPRALARSISTLVVTAVSAKSNMDLAICALLFRRTMCANCDSDPDRVLREVVMQNSRAAKTLEQARLHSAWLSVSLEGFGRKALTPANGLLTIGDAASFIDPFTGSGMLMAFESGQVVAEAIKARMGSAGEAQTIRLIAKQYERE